MEILTTKKKLIQFEYTPYRKIVVHDLIELDNERFFEDILRLQLATNPNVEPSINWIEGIAFSIFSIPDTPEVVKEKLKGIIH